MEEQKPGSTSRKQNSEMIDLNYINNYISLL